MTLSNAMTSLMDKARELTGLSEKISLSRLTELMNHFDLHVNPNLILADKINVAVTSHTKDAYPNWQNEYISNPLKPDTTYTISACATTSDTRVANASIRIWNDRTNTPLLDKNGSWEPSLWIFPADGKRHSYTFTTDNKGASSDGYNYVLWAYAGVAGREIYGFDFTTIYRDIKLEVGDLATPFEKLGGVAKALLCVLLPVRGCAA